MKRYAIIRIDNRCPMNIEQQLDEIERDEMFSRCKDLTMNCKDCLYGDTKEQFISKVEQIIRRPIQKGDLELKSKGFKYGVRRLAKEIVEFLGVEE